MNDDIDWYGPEAATFGDRVAAARDASGMTQAALSRRLGIRQATLRAWEDDLSEPRANRLSMLAGLQNVSMMWLINGEGEGIDAPDDAATGVGDVNGVITELRILRTDMLKKAEALGQLEKRLRRILAEPANG